MWKKLSWKKSLLLIGKILGLFLNTFTAGDKYSPLNCDSLIEPIQMELSKKKKDFLMYFLNFAKLY